MARRARGLAAYHAKRDFGVTPEPRGRRAATSSRLQFVVQKHHARQLHYDFRLELDGTLKSWAVPKGPSLDPAVKRLAVHVEDHPVEYGSFEGTIPPHQYGAGEVVLWDRGTWIPAGDARRDYEAGKLKFELRGNKLRGHWTLVRTRLPGSGGKEQWLLLKERDAQARPQDEYDVTSAQPDSVNRKRARGSAGSDPPAAGASPRRKSRAGRQDPVAAGLTNAVRGTPPAKLAPQLATLVERAPEGDWSYELKYDGYRLLARISGGRAALFTRNGHEWTPKLREQARALEALGLEDGWLDGEIVVANDKGRPDFQALQNAFDADATGDIHYFVFDLPWYGGYDLRMAPLVERRGLLQALLARDRDPRIHFSETIAASGDVLDAACRLGMEGVIGKRADSAYASGRSRSWIKLKCEHRQEFVVGGFTDPQRSRTGLGALLLGVHEQGVLRYAGRTGTGFDERSLGDLRRKLAAIEVRSPPFANPPTGAQARGVHWVRPRLVAEVSFAQWTHDGLVRQAVFHGLRSDKPAAEIGLEKPAFAPRTRASAARAASPSHPEPSRAKAARVEVGGVSISHPTRVIDAASGLTKLDVARYYEAIAPALLPHLEDRPVSLVRLPDGLAGGQFFQKHLGKGQIPEARLLDRALDPGHPPLLVLESKQALVGAAQMGVLELHTWNAVAASIERPDRVVFDLDPGPRLPWERVLEAAALTRELLEQLGLRSFAKTSGGKGLHLVVPLRRVHDWDTAKAFSRAVADHLARTLPRQFSAKMGAANRVGKVFVDYLRNTRGSTTVSAWSLRARPRLPVSVPIAWKELETLRGADEWTLENAPDRFARQKTDPWKAYEQSRQDLEKAIAALRAAKA
jgi:bifunctional non-homologous end joining protein LigD